MGVIAKEEINPAVPDKKRVLVRLDKGGQNWYLRLRQHGRYRFVSLGTPDLTDARRIAFLDPPDPNPKQSLSIRRALLDFKESRQQLLDAPGETQSIRLNTFKAYKARVDALIHFFEQQQVIKKESQIKRVGALTASDFTSYRNWREREGMMLTTVKSEINQINTILSWFFDNEYIPKAIKLPLPKIKPEKYRKSNRLLEDEEFKLLKSTLHQMSTTGDLDKQKRWHLYALWLEWLENTFTRPHECRLLRFEDVREFIVDGKTVVQFSTRPETKTGERLVYATSKVKGKLLRLYQSWRLLIEPTSPLFLLPQGRPPSSSWFSDMWQQLIKQCGFKVKSRELTQYSLRHQGINTLLLQGVPPTKVADLAGHSLAIQQKIYKKYSLDGDHSVLRDDKKKPNSKRIETSINTDIPFPWEVDPVTGECFPEDE